MHIRDMNWMQVEAYLEHDDRAIVPLGSTEQHAQLSLMVDAILSERAAVEAAEPLGIPVFPTVSYGVTPYFTAFPGTISMRVQTLVAVFQDIFDSLHHAGFRRIVVVNGHGGNHPIESLTQEWMSAHPETCLKFHNWFNAPRTWQKVKEIDPVASHASWMENFPWTRLAHAAAPDGQKPMISSKHLRMLNPAQVREHVGDGNFGGVYEKPDDDMLALWEIGVQETRDVMNGPWP